MRPMWRAWLCLSLAWMALPASAAEPWLAFQGKEGPGKGKHIVLISGDEEYRSEEGLPMLAKILAKHHGFTCTVLFAINEQTGEIDPNTSDDIPGLDALRDADLMVIATRFRNLPDEQMKMIVDYIDSGRPVIGMRTATHAFNVPAGRTYRKYSFDYEGDDFKEGFGRQILGETWVSHHGDHGKQSTRGILAEAAKDHPVLRGVEDIWGPTDVYGIRALPEGTTPLVLGQVLQGMKPTDAPVSGKKNEPMMPVAWVRTYQAPGGESARIFNTTMGASRDLQSEGLRRLLVNACYWAIGLEDQIPARANVEIVGPYEPRPFGFGGFRKGLHPGDFLAGAEDLATTTPRSR